MENETNIPLGVTKILLTLFSSLHKNNIFGAKNKNTLSAQHVGGGGEG